MRGDLGAAESFIVTALQDQSWDRLARARLLPARVEIALAAGKVEDVALAANELHDIADTYQTIALEASAAMARGQLANAQGDSVSAANALRTAMQRWLDLPAPFEAARARLSLADALRNAGSSENAQVECEAARAAFERLGAAPFVLQADQLTARLARAKNSREAAPARVTRTFVFTDIVGSTSLLQAIGDQAWADLVRWHDQTLRGQFAAHRGEEIDHAGDGFFVAFGSTDAALDCASAIQRELAQHRKEHGFAPHVRIGVHRSEANSGAEGYSGLGVHHAARIAAEAQGNEILVSRAAADTTSAARAYSEARSIALKGISQPTEVVSLDW